MNKFILCNRVSFFFCHYEEGLYRNWNLCTEEIILSVSKTHVDVTKID